jgi:hypothetical protein
MNSTPKTRLLRSAEGNIEEALRQLERGETKVGLALLRSAHESVRAVREYLEQ